MLTAITAAIENAALTLCADAADRVTRRAPSVIPDAPSSWLDIRVHVTDKSGGVNNFKVNFELILQATMRQEDAVTAMDMAEFACEYAAERITSSGNQYFASHESTSYQQDVEVGAGNTVVNHIARMRFQIRHMASGGAIEGINVSTDAGASIPVTLRDTAQRAFLAERGALLPLEEGGTTINVLFAGATGAAIASIIDSDDAVVDSLPVSGLGRQPFTIESVGEYRARLVDGAVTITDEIPVRIVQRPQAA